MYKKQFNTQQTHTHTQKMKNEYENHTTNYVFSRLNDKKKESKNINRRLVFVKKNKRKVMKNQKKNAK